MQILVVFKKHWLNWLVLFASTLVLAIALAQVFASSQWRQQSIDLASRTPISPSPTMTTSQLELQPKYERRFAHYATVSRSDGAFRQMFIDEASLAQVEPGQPLPDNTLILMETWQAPETLSTVFIKQKYKGVWQYGSFSPDQPNYQTRVGGSCHSCHVPFESRDFTLTLPLLEAALQTQQVQTAFCDRPGRTPCHPDTYLPNRG